MVVRVNRFFSLFFLGEVPDEIEYLDYPSAVFRGFF